MRALQNQNRITALLKILGADSEHPVVDLLDPKLAEEVRSGFKSVSGIDHKALEAVLDDFDRFFRFAVKTMDLADQMPVPRHVTDASHKGTESDSDSELVSGAGAADLRVFVPPEDALNQLHTLQPEQIAAALREEHPRTTAIVLSQLDKPIAANVLDQIPDELQPEVLLLLNQELSGSRDMIDRVILSTLQKASTIEVVQVETESTDQRLVDTLRALPKKTRNRLIEEMKERDPEVVERIQNSLYLFEDLLLYDKRSIQKILGGIQSDVLVVAVQDAPQNVLDAVFDNLSKRAGDVLKEEMSYRAKSSEEEVDVARKDIAGTISQLDSDGELTLL